MGFPMLLLPSVVVAITSLLLYVYVRSIFEWRARTRGRPFPPGPKSLPIIGHFFSMPKYKPWTTYRDLCAKYGDVLHFRLLGQSIVVLGSAEVILEYLEQRSANTSDRKQSPMIELSGSSFNFAVMPYGQWWRRHRRAFWHHYNPQASLDYRPVQRAFAHMFLSNLLDDPVSLQRNIRYTFAGAILKVVYDIDIANSQEDFYTIADNVLEGGSQGLIPGRFLAEFFPFLRHIPTWLPGTSSQKLFAKWQAAADKLKNAPFHYVKACVEQEPAITKPSVVSKMLSKLGDEELLSDEEEVQIIKDIGAVSFEAGADTLYSSVQSMFLAMSLHPDALKKAHAELDTVVGPHRLPDFGDESSLVYIQAVVKESARWLNVLPLAVPHCTTDDDELYGYFIPAGTVLMANVWACLHDPEVYNDPEEFRPDRFIRDGRLDAKVRDPFAFAFGFGRRICPGRHFAQAGLFINIASVLHVFDITLPIGKDGLPIKIEPEMTDGLSSYPADCRCTIKPRAAWAEALIRASRTHEMRVSDSGPSFLTVVVPADQLL